MRNTLDHKTEERYDNPSDPIAKLRLLGDHDGVDLHEYTLVEVALTPVRMKLVWNAGTVNTSSGVDDQKN